MEGDNKSVKKPNSKTYGSQSLDTNKSILDFKSPKIKPIEEIKLFSFDSTKSTKKQAQLKIGLDNKASTSKQMQGKLSNDAHMQTISNMSFDKEDRSANLPTNTMIAYVCPLCFKNYKDNNSRIFHMKNCATKNKVSMKKLLQAMELQERQTAERVSLGLPGAPILENKKQTSIRRTAMNQDSELQLALALSKSLHEVKEIKNSSQTEQDFITSSTKNPVENITSRIERKKRQNIVSVLQIRSQEERDRLLTEKIAEILVDSEALIQRQQQAKNENESRKKDNLRSNVLKKFLNFDNQLWNTAMLQLNQTDFFAKDLLPYVIPSEQKQRSMENINEINDMKKFQQKDRLAIIHDSRSDKETSLNISRRMDAKLFEDKKDNIKQSCINNLIVDWGNALNNSSSSDVIIFVNGGKQIWVHKLVFLVRCPNILLDLIPNENRVYLVKESIYWTNVDYYIALAFLEFIYCGIIEKYPIYSNDSVAISSLGSLARRYKVKELFPYLRHAHVISHGSISMDNEFKVDEEGTQEIYYANDKENKLISTSGRDSNVVKCSNQDTFDVTTTTVSQNQILKINMSSPEKCTIPNSHIDRENSISPDIFDDIDNVTLNHSDNTKLMNIENSRNHIEHDLLNSNQYNLRNVALNQQLSTSLTNTNRNSTNEYTLMKSIMTTSKFSQTEQVTDKIADKVKPKSDLTLFIEEVQKENESEESEENSEMDSPLKSFIKNNRNPFRKAEYAESSIILDRFDNNEHSPKAGKKVSNLSKLESDMQVYVIENPQLCNITIDENLKFTTPFNHNYTDFSSPTTDINLSIACNDESEVLEKNLQENNISMTTSYSSSSEIETDDANISTYTKYKRKHINNSIAIYRSALKKHKNNIIEVESDRSKNTEIIMSNSANNYSDITKCASNDIDHTRNNRLNGPSLSNMAMVENFSIKQMEKITSNLEFSRKSNNETKISNTFRDNVSQSADSLKMPKLDNWNYDKFIISCDTNNLKTHNTNAESSNDDCSSIMYLHSPELDNVEKQQNSPLKSRIYSNPILISSNSDIDLSSADNNDFSKYDNERVASTKTQTFDLELQQFFWNATSSPNVNIENKIVNVALDSSSLQIYKKNRKLRRSRSEGSLQHNYNIGKNNEICEFDSTLTNNYKSNAMNRLLTITESSDISSPNYDIMDTPKLHLEMKKYGLKIQNRKKAIKLLTYIYNELHTTISSFETPVAAENVENTNNEDEEPQTKKQKSDAHLSTKDNVIQYESNMSPLKILSSKEYSKEYSRKKETEAVANVGIDNVVSLSDCVNITEAFFKLLSFNKDLHNSILRYEPLNIELIHCLLKNGGFKCNIKALTEFLDEQCITYRSAGNKTKIRNRKIHNRLK